MRRFYAAAMGGKATAGVAIVSEDCEGTGTPASWTNTGSPNWDYTAVPLDGAQSLYLACASASVRSRIDWTDLTEVFAYFMVRFTNGTGPAAGNVAAGGISANGSAATTLGFTLSNAARLTWAPAGSPSATISVDTTYHVWYHYIQGTGANAIGEFGFSTTGVRPTGGTTFSSGNTGAQTNLAGRLWLGPSATTLNYDVIFDKIRIAATQIGDNGTL